MVDLVEVRWPSGQVDVFKNLEVNRLYVLREGNNRPELKELVGLKKRTHRRRLQSGLLQVSAKRNRATRWRHSPRNSIRGRVRRLWRPALPYAYILKSPVPQAAIQVFGNVIRQAMGIPGKSKFHPYVTRSNNRYSLEVNNYASFFLSFQIN